MTVAKLSAATVLTDPSSGAPVALLAGTVLPGWAEGMVGDHLLAVEDAQGGEVDATPTGRWTVAEIDAYAEAHGVDLGGASTKTEKLAAIAAASE